jgi:hypothetical protein
MLSRRGFDDEPPFVVRTLQVAVLDIRPRRHGAGMVDGKGNPAASSFPPSG